MKYINDYINQKNKKKIMVRANKECELCGKEAVLIHHKDFSDNNHDMNNLIALFRYEKI